MWLAGSGGGIEAVKAKQVRLSDRFATHDRPGPSLHSTYRQDPTSLHHPKPQSRDPRGRSPPYPKTSSNRLHRPKALKYPPTVRTYKPYKPWTLKHSEKVSECPRHVLCFIQVTLQRTGCGRTATPARPWTLQRRRKQTFSSEEISRINELLPKTEGVRSF